MMGKFKPSLPSVRPPGGIKLPSGIKPPSGVNPKPTEANPSVTPGRVGDDDASWWK